MNYLGQRLGKIHKEDCTINRIDKRWKEGDIKAAGENEKEVK